MEEHHERIKIWMAWCLIITALSIDGFCALLNLLVIGEVLSPILQAVATFGFIIWFWMLGVTFIKNPKKLAAMGGQAIIGLIPIINTLPELTAGVILTIYLTWGEDRGGVVGKTIKIAEKMRLNK